MKKTQTKGLIDMQFVVQDKYALFHWSCVMSAKVVRKNSEDTKQLHRFVLYSAPKVGNKDLKNRSEFLAENDLIIIRWFYKNKKSFRNGYVDLVFETNNDSQTESVGVLLQNYTPFNAEWAEAFGTERTARAIIKVLVKFAYDDDPVVWTNIQLAQFAFNVNNEEIDVIPLALHNCILYEFSGAVYATNFVSEIGRAHV